MDGLINENQIQQEILMQDPAVQDAEFYKKKTDAYTERHVTEHAIKFRLAELDADKTLSEKKLALRYEKTPAGQDFAEDVRKAQEEGRNVGSSKLNGYAYRFMRNYNSAKAQFETDYQETKAIYEIPLTAEDHQKIESIRAEYALMIEKRKDGRLEQEQRAKNAHLTGEYLENYITTYMTINTEERLLKRRDASIADVLTKRQRDKDDYYKSGLLMPWMDPGNKEKNAAFLRAYFGKTSERILYVRRMVNEVIAYDFNVHMVNKHWLAENAATFLRMIRRAEDLPNLISEDKNQLTKREVALVETKSKEAVKLLEIVTRFFEQQGLKRNDWGSKNFEIKADEVHAGENRAEKKQREKEERESENKYIDKLKGEFGILKQEEERLLRTENRKDTYPDEVAKLSFSDFLRMIGSKNRGQVVLAGGKLTLINNGFFKRKNTGTEAAEHVLLKRHFVELALSKLEAKEREVYRTLFENMVGLDGYSTTTKPLSRKQIVAVLHEIGTHTSEVKRTLHAGQDDHPYKAYAEKIDILFGDEPKEGDVPAVKKRKTAAVKQQIRQALERARAAGMRVGKLSDSQLNTLLNRDLSMLKDEIFRAFRVMDNTVNNAVGGDRAALMEDGKLWDRIAAHVILRMTEKDASRRTLDDVRMDRFLVDAAFEKAGRPELADGVKKIASGSFTYGGADSVYASLSGKRLTKDQRADIETLLRLMDGVSELSRANETMMTREGSNPAVDQKTVMETAHVVQHMLTGETEALDRAATMLAGTRFAAGYEEWKRRVQAGFSFVATENSLLTTLGNVHEDRSALNPPEEAREDALKIRALSAEEEAVLAGMSKDEQMIAGILLMSKLPSELIKKERDTTAQSILLLYKTLKSVQPGQEFVTGITVGDCTMRLCQDRDCTLTLVARNGKLTIPLPTNRILDYVEADICDHVKQFGYDEVFEACFSDAENRFIKDRDARPDEGETVRMRNLCTRVSASVSGAPKALFENTETHILIGYVRELLLEKKKPKNVVGYSDKMDRIQQINDKETEMLLDRLVKEDAAEDDHVVFLPREEEEREAGPKWDETEEKVKNLIADMVYGDTYMQDRDINVQDQLRYARPQDETLGTMFFHTLMTHADSLCMVLADDTLLDRTVNSMSIPDAEEGQPDFKQSVLAAVKEGLKKLSQEAGLEGKSAEEIRSILTVKQSEKKLTDLIKSTQKKINLAVEKGSKVIQDELAKCVNDIFKSENNKIQEAPLPNPDEKGISKEERDERLALHSKRLNREIAQASKSESGQGAFTKKVLSEYFVRSKATDQKSMMGELFRYAVKKNVLPENATEEQKAEEKMKQRGNTLAGYLKGAGPLFQKILQGLPEHGMPPEMKYAIADMKSNLKPIPERIVKARFSAMIKRSGNTISKIDVVRSLGAASVGQAFLCRFYGPNLPEEGEEVVVKMLRPDARNRMRREKIILEDCAREIDQKAQGGNGGMGDTLNGQLARIAEELDLTLEATNARRGLIYDTADHTVKTVEVSKLIEPTTNTLVLKKAPGTTVDRYIKDVRQTREALKKDIEQAKGPELARRRKKLEEMLARLEKRQGYLAGVAEKWVKEGLYGEGFYHGDLHAGNILIDDNGATVIDFGNATKLDDQQKIQLTRLTAAAAAGMAGDFVDAFHELLPKSADEKFKRLEKKLKTVAENAFALGNKESAGQRILLIILKAQELGLQIPGSIYNFSQSQIRIQNTVDDVTELIRGVRSDIDAIDKASVADAKIDISLLLQKEAVEGQKNHDTLIGDFLAATSFDAGKMREDLKSTGDAQVQAFYEKYMVKLPEESAEAGVARVELQALRTAQQRAAAGQTDPNDPLTLEERETRFIEAYNKAFESYRLTTPYADKVKESLSARDEDTVLVVEAELKNYFEDKENYGAEIEAAYRAYREAPGEETEAAFLKLYFKASEKRLLDIKKQRDDRTKRPMRFFKVMTKILKQNLAVSISRLGGIFKANRYRTKLA